HAIVYVPGAPPLWIDPTYGLADALELPLAVHGRLALVANDQTKDLVRIPRVPSSQNFSRVKSELKLEGTVGGTSTEVSGSRGSSAADRRNDFLLQTSSQLRTAFEQFSENNLHSKAITRLAYPDPADRSKPMRVELEVANALLAGATAAQATLEVDPSVVLRR